MKKMIFLAAALALLGAGCASSPDSSNPPTREPANPPTPIINEAVTSTTPIVMPTPTPTPALAFPGVLPATQVNKKVLIKTTLGNIVIQVDSKAGPNAASNFVYLVKQGFYNGTIFHRVIPGFMIQGGDPTGTGRGDPGYRFADDPVKSAYNDGVVAMANSGPDTNGSQFFIMVADYPLEPNYSIFGKVVSGLDVARKIANVERDANDRPLTEVKILSVTIE